MHSQTLSADFSRRPNLASPPLFDLPTLRALRLCGKFSIFSSLPPLELSCLSFSASSRLFSVACSLFAQNAGVGIPSHTVIRCLRQQIDLLALCFQLLANPFSRNPFVCTSIQNPGGGVGLLNGFSRPRVSVHHLFVEEPI